MFGSRFSNVHLLFSAVLAVSALAGCRSDSVIVVRADHESIARPLAVGERVEVSATVVHPEIEGSSMLPAVTLETSDIHVVRTEPGGSGFYLYAIAPGVATLHATTDGFPDADFVVTVEAAQ